MGTANLYKVSGQAVFNALSVASTSISPLKLSESLNHTDSYEGFESISDFMTEKKYLDKTVDDVSILESSLENNIAGLIQKTVDTGSTLKHWELLINFGQRIVFWSICFANDGLTSRVVYDKQQIIKTRSDNQIQKLAVRPGLKVKDVLYVIETVKEIKYNIVKWNCQHFTNYIIERIRPSYENILIG